MSEPLRRRGKIIDRVIAELTNKPGEVIYATDIASRHGLSVDQVQKCVATSRQRHSDLARQIRIDIPGRAWSWHPDAVISENIEPEAPPPPPSKRLFEEVGVTKDGVIVAQDGEGGIFKVVELTIEP